MKPTARERADVARAAAAGLADYADNARAMPNERAGRLLRCLLDYIDASETAEHAAAERMRERAAEAIEPQVTAQQGLNAVMLHRRAALVEAARVIRALPLEDPDDSQ